MCIAFGLCTTRYDSPDEPKFHGLPKVNSTWESAYGDVYSFPQADLFVSVCESDQVKSPSHGFVNGIWTAMPMAVGRKIMVKDPNPDCIHNNPESMTAALLCIIG